jgi:hypothetical protein
METPKEGTSYPAFLQNFYPPTELTELDNYIKIRLLSSNSIQHAFIWHRGVSFSVVVINAVLPNLEMMKVSTEGTQLYSITLRLHLSENKLFVAAAQVGFRKS